MAIHCTNILEKRVQDKGSQLPHLQNAQKLKRSLENCLTVISTPHFYTILALGEFSHEFTTLLANLIDRG